MASSFHLLVALPDKDPVSYSISGEKVSLGRSPANDIQILVREISTSHCEFTKTESGYAITDSGSTNGTKVNDRSVKDSTELNSRDVILLGETVPSYFIVAEEGADIDLQAEIDEIEKARSAPKKPTVKNLTAPGAEKKVELPTKKPLEPIPVAVATPANDSDVGAATVKLAQTPPRPTTKLGAPPVAKPAVPGGPPAPAAPLSPPTPGGPPSAPKLPTAPPVKKLAPPGSGDASPAAPAPTPASPLPPVKKLPAPGVPPAAPGTPPSVPALKPPGPPSKKLAIPPKKAPKLNLPDKED